MDLSLIGWHYKTRRDFQVHESYVHVFSHGPIEDSQQRGTAFGRGVLFVELASAQDDVAREDLQRVVKGVASL
jgi:hypothetical protein